MDDPIFPAIPFQIDPAIIQILAGPIIADDQQRNVIRDEIRDQLESRGIETVSFLIWLPYDGESSGTYKTVRMDVTEAADFFLGEICRFMGIDYPVPLPF